MKKLVFVEDNEVLENLKELFTDDFILISFFDLFGTNDFCLEIFHNKKNIRHKKNALFRSKLISELAKKCALT